MRLVLTALLKCHPGRPGSTHPRSRCWRI